MSSPIVRRKPSQRRKTFTALASLITAGVLVLVPASMAGATDDAVVEGDTTAQVEAPPTEEVVAPETEDVAVVEESTPVVEDSAPAADNTSKPAAEPAPDPVVEEVVAPAPAPGPAPEPPAESTSKVAPAVAPATVDLIKVYPAVFFPNGCTSDEGGGYTFNTGASGEDTVGVVYHYDGNDIMTETAESGYVSTAVDGPTWVINDDGSATAYFTGSLSVSGVIDTNCGEPPVEPTCVDAALTRTPDVNGIGSVTASNPEAKQGTKLCNPLAVRATTYSYDLPTNGNNPSWAQTKVGYNDVLVDSIGTFPYAAPAKPATCSQRDIYAEFVSEGGFDALDVPDHLLGPNNPYEPPFLHQRVAGEGNTWTTTPSTDCGPPVVPEPKVVTSNWQDGEWVCGDTTVTQTRTVTTTNYKVVRVDGEWVVVEDTENTTPQVTEYQTRKLSNEEIGTCPLGVGNVGAVCVGDVPYFAYAAPVLPNGFVLPEDATMSVTFNNPAGDDYVVDGLDPSVAGKFLWPGATDGLVKNWPGWVLNADGTYSQTTGNFAWTRPSVSVTFVINPEYTTTVAYPESSSTCANPPAPPVVTPPVTTVSNPLPPATPTTLAATGTNDSELQGNLSLAVWSLLGGIVLVTGVQMLRRREAKKQLL